MVKKITIFGKQSNQRHKKTMTDFSSHSFIILQLIQTENCDEVMDLQEAFKMLDQKYKTVIISRFFEELTLKEIAMVLEIPLSTVLETTLGRRV